MTNPADRIPDDVLETIITRIIADIAEPKWCSVCQDRPACIGEFCHVCLPDDPEWK